MQKVGGCVVGGVRWGKGGGITVCASQGGVRVINESVLHSTRRRKSANTQNQQSFPLVSVAFAALGAQAAC